jgi:hypothetical protein
MSLQLMVSLLVDTGLISKNAVLSQCFDYYVLFCDVNYCSAHSHHTKGMFRLTYLNLSITICFVRLFWRTYENSF